MRPNGDLYLLELQMQTVHEMQVTHTRYQVVQYIHVHA